jgi:hypothetical protein
MATRAASPAVDAHFKDRNPALRPIYERLFLIVRRFGPVVEDPKKGSIHLDRRSAFAEVVVRKDDLVVAFKAHGNIESPRIFKSMNASAHRWYLYTRLSNVKEIDRKLTEWLRNSYELSA